VDLNEVFGKSTIGETLLTPTTIYVKTLEILSKSIDINAIAHITGGGLTENIPRVLPINAKAVIKLSSWERPPIFSWLQKLGNIEEDEMRKTFNCGIGMVVCVDSKDAKTALEILNKSSAAAVTIGEIVGRSESEEQIAFI
jgi:phosphoribosylformylglycinamidine cyclo-ligase